jgi:hypothetical protein
MLGALIAPCIASEAQGLSPEAIIQELSSTPETPQAEPYAKEFNLTGEAQQAECGAFSAVSQKTLWRDGTAAIVAIEAYSETCFREFLIILEGNQSLWKYAGTIALEERDTKPEYRIIPLSANQEPGIAVTNNTVDSGTGISQQNTQIFAFVGSSLRLVFNEPEHIRLTLPFRPNCCPVQYVEGQTSTFHFVFPTTKGATTSIEERRQVSVNGHSLTEYRRYLWDSRWQAFYSVAFAPAP